MTIPRKALGAALLAAFIGCVLLANWLVAHFGVVPVGFGLRSPAAVFSIGLALTLRDGVQATLGRSAVFAAIIVGAALSWLVAPAFALASGVAFLVSELADLAVYTPLERRTWLGAVLLSNTVGLALDSYLFLTLSGLGLAFFWGQVLGKGYMTLLTVAAIAAGRRALLPRHA